MNPTLLASMTGVVAAFAGLFLVFLLLRELWCWYWKINAAMTELRAIRGLLEALVQQGVTRPADAAPGDPNWALPPPLPLRKAGS